MSRTDTTIAGDRVADRERAQVDIRRASQLVGQDAEPPRRRAEGDDSRTDKPEARSDRQPADRKSPPKPEPDQGDDTDKDGDDKAEKSGGGLRGLIRKHPVGAIVVLLLIIAAIAGG